MKPTVQAKEHYMIGNDYPQAPISAFFDPGEKNENYQDGIFTKLADSLATSGFEEDPWKNPAGFNKREVLLNNEAAYSDEDYSKADVIEGVFPDSEPVSGVAE